MTQYGNGGNRPNNGHGNGGSQNRYGQQPQNRGQYPNQQNRGNSGYNNRPNNSHHNPQNNHNNNHGGYPPPRQQTDVPYTAVANLGLLFNKLLYINETPAGNAELNYGIREEANGHDIKAKLDALYAASKAQMTTSKALLAPPEELGTDSILLKTLYPGLYAGLGYRHGVPGDSADIKNGFSFDYTSGLPVLPASSVKGCLRSGLTEKKEDALCLIQQIFPACGLEAPDLQGLHDLVNTLFGPDAEKENTSLMKERIIFFDAYPVACDDRLLGPDYITPHPGNGLIEPKPIKMLKVCGGVTWRFPMLFPGNMAENKKTALKLLFTQIMIGWGVGAKTNVGYGNLIEV